MPEINKNTIHKLKSLARIEISAEKEEKLRSDLDNIVKYFDEIKLLNLENKKFQKKESALNNVLRDDKKEVYKFNRNKLVESFPETKNGFLKIPPVF